MASNLPKKSARYTQPTMRKLRFILDHTASAAHDNQDSHFLDLSWALSIANRRLYRQGLVYAIKGVEVRDTTSDSFVKVNTLPDTWTTRAAWVRGFRMYQRMIRQTPGAKGLEGTWADFKVYMNKNHSSQPNSDIMKPCSAGDIQAGNAATAANVNYELMPSGEWVYSKYVSENPELIDPDNDGGLEKSSADADEYEAYMLGPHTKEDANGNRLTHVGLIASYADSRATVSSDHPRVQNNASTDPLQQLFDSGDSHDDILENLEDDNDSPPYSITTYVGDQHTEPYLAQQLQVSPSNPIAKCGGFVAPLGLVEFVTKSAVDNKIEVVVEVMEGDYQGVAAANYI